MAIRRRPAGAGAIAATSVLANITGAAAAASAATRAQLAGVGLSPPDGWAEARGRAIRLIAPTLTEVIQFGTHGISTDLVPTTGGGVTAVVQVAEDVPGSIRIATVSGANSYKPIAIKDYGVLKSVPVLSANQKTKPWAVATRIRQVTAFTTTEAAVFGGMESLDASSFAVAGLGFGDSTHLGLRVRTGADTIQNYNGSGGSSVALAEVGVFHNCTIVFDMTTVWLLYDDVKMTPGITDLSQLPSSPGTLARMYVNSVLATANREMTLSKVAVYMPPDA